MATYSNNTTIKVGSTISYNSSSWSYTVPSGSYLVLKYLSAASGFSGYTTINITLPGIGVVVSFNGTSSPNNYLYQQNYELPAGTVISSTPTGGLPGNGTMSGFLMTNTP